MKPETEQDGEPDTLSGIFDDLLASMNETLEWARGERELCTFTRSTDDAFYTKPEPELADTMGDETGVNGKFAPAKAATPLTT